MAKTIYTYEIVANNTAIVTDLESRDLARQELALVKKQDYPTAKIFTKEVQTRICSAGSLIGF